MTKFLRITLLLLVFPVVGVQAQKEVLLHRGDEAKHYNVMWTIKGDKVYGGSTSNAEGYQYFIEHNRFYKGKYKKSDNCVFTIKGNKVYAGRVISSNNCAYTIRGNHVFLKNTTELLYTLQDGKVYIGDVHPDKKAFMIAEGATTFDLPLLTCIIEIDYHVPSESEESASRTVYE